MSFLSDNGILVVNIGSQTGIMMTEESSLPEWITTVEAMDILKVSDTRSVRYLMDKYPDEFKTMNVGSDKQPRWLLWRDDVIAFQNKRQPPNKDS